MPTGRTGRNSSSTRARWGSAIARGRLEAKTWPMARSSPASFAALLEVALSRYGRRAGIPARLAHPHALRAYYATTLRCVGRVRDARR